MRRIRQIRDGLEKIPGCIKDFPPEPGFRGEEPGVPVTTIWRGEGDYEDAPAMSHKLFPESEEEDENDGTPPEFDPVIEIGTDVDETFPALEGEAGEEIRRSVLQRGMDGLGQYVSFHGPGIQWGIYIPVTGIADLIKDALSELPVPLLTKAHLAFHAILNHELFHFRRDYTIAQVELIHQEPWFFPAREAFRRQTPDYCVIEEQLANAYMLKAFRTMKPALKVRGKQRALIEFTKEQPEGYREGHLIKSQDWDRCLTALAQEYGRHSTKGAANPLLWKTGLGFDWPGQFPIRPRIDWRYCPIHFVDDGERLGIPPGWLNFFAPILAIEEGKKFLKKLRDMPKSIQQRWEETKLELARKMMPGARFKPWGNRRDGIYSVRLNDSYRAHIQRQSAGEPWIALDIGTHKEMGHG